TSRVDAIRREIRVSWRCMLEHPEYGLRGFLENCDEIENKYPKSTVYEALKSVVLEHSSN
ncbi:MAG: hypothetical protein ACTSUE_01915, partial [Promethearchaeota archaeon]